MSHLVSFPTYRPLAERYRPVGSTRLPEPGLSVGIADGLIETTGTITKIFSRVVGHPKGTTHFVDRQNISVILPDGTEHGAVHLFASRAEAHDWMYHKDDNGQLARAAGTYILAFWPDA